MFYVLISSMTDPLVRHQLIKYVLLQINSKKTILTTPQNQMFLFSLATRFIQKMIDSHPFSEWNNKEEIREGNFLRFDSPFVITNRVSIKILLWMRVKMGSLLYRKNIYIVQQITDEIKTYSAWITYAKCNKNNSFHMQTTNSYDQQDNHLFFDTAKYRISKAKKNEEKNETYGKVTLFQMSSTTIRRSRVGYIMNDEEKRERFNLTYNTHTQMK